MSIEARLKTIEWFFEAGKISKEYGQMLATCIARHAQPCVCQLRHVLGTTVTSSTPLGV